MAMVNFPSVTVLESRFGQSNNGNTYCIFRFLDGETLNVYDCIQFGDSASVAAGCSKGSVVSLGFDIVPAREGGVRLVLVSLGAV